MLILPIFILNEDWSDWIEEENNLQIIALFLIADPLHEKNVEKTAGGTDRQVIFVWHRSSGTAQSKVMEHGPGKHRRLTDSGFLESVTGISAVIG